MTAKMAAHDQAWANGLRQRWFPPERNHIPAHITLFHHLPPGVLPELRDQLRTIALSRPPSARGERFYSLGRGVALLVESPQLLAIRDAVADRFHGSLIPQDMARPRLHITIQNKVTPEVARATLTTVQAGYVPRPLGIAALALWFYRGGPWEPIAEYAFRG